ncbi:hypothetical protein FF255_18420, partial [Bordetella pertussis]
SVCPTKTLSRISRPPRGPHDFANEGLGSRCSVSPIADPTWPRSQFIVAPFHGVLRGLKNQMAQEPLIGLAFPGVCRLAF